LTLVEGFPIKSGLVVHRSKALFCQTAPHHEPSRVAGERGNTVITREIKLTKEGFQRLGAQLEIEQQRLLEATTILENQMEDSDDYDGGGLEDAKRQKLSIEMRIAELQETLANAVVLDGAEVGKTVGLGNTVRLKEEKSGKEMDVQLVSGAEVSVLSAGIRKVSDDSPLGQKLMGRKKNEMFVVDVERGQLKYKVLEIR
jgi:transcription elongation factor GreA